MWDKHSVWSQCALVFPATLALACLFSCQHFTLHEDVYWSCVFGVSTVLQFLAAEHGPFGYDTHMWQTLSAHKLFIVRCIILTSCVTQWSVWWRAAILIPLCGVSLLAQQYHHILLGAVVVHNVLLGTSWVHILSYWCVERWANYYFSKTIETSLADKTIKYAYGCTAVSIVLENIVLWSLRCQQRFPHTFRWSPLCIGLIACAVAFAWAEFNIQDTLVSQNTIIKRRGHNVAASLTAAKACPQCCSCLTSLDMESSFGE